MLKTTTECKQIYINEGKQAKFDKYFFLSHQIVRVVQPYKPLNIL